MTPRAWVLIASAVVLGAGAFLAWKLTRPEKDEGIRHPVLRVNCELPEFRPKYFPWLDKGEEVRRPLNVAQLHKSISRWKHRDSGTEVSLTRADLSPEELGSREAFPRVRVRNRPGRLVWIGDPGVGELALIWQEPVGPCPTHRLTLLAPGTSQKRAETELKKVARSLEVPR